MIMELRRRSIVKSITWRVFGILITMLVVYQYNKDIKKSLIVSLCVNAVKIILYYLHERFWNRIDFGRKKVIPDYQI